MIDGDVCFDIDIDDVEDGGANAETRQAVVNNNNKTRRRIMLIGEDACKGGGRSCRRPG